MAELGMEISNNYSRFCLQFSNSDNSETKKEKQTFYVRHIALA